MNTLPNIGSEYQEPTPTKSHHSSWQCHQDEIHHTSPPAARSLEVLGSNLFSERKLSAFSIYLPDDPQPPQAQEAQISQDLQQSFVPKCKSQVNDSHGLRGKREQARSETKNMNRFFRSKINEMLREVREDQRSSKEDARKATQLLQQLNKSNKIMFSEMREVIEDEWLREKFSKCRGLLLKYVHKGKMGMQSKLTMLKYFNKILGAIQNPQQFCCWK